MRATLVIRLIAVASFLALLAALFMLYQNPLFEIYLSSWGLC